ncbi:MAG TPA: two-component sensor histidine kinase [Janthinobacterium sp.]|nr:two-component sensor histidine kinase [Janthinobacterium sp.]
MGRLFWKFFLCILLAQLTATVGIGGTFWLNDRARQRQNALDIDASPPALLSIEAAAATLEFGGTAALRRLLDGMQRHRVYAVDESGADLLGRAVAPAMLVEAHRVLERGERRRVVRELAAADGHRYLLFLPSSERPRGFAPGFEHGMLAALAPGLGPGQHRPRADGTDAAPEPGAGSGPPTMRGAPFEPRYWAFIPLAAATLASLLFAALLAWYFSRPIRALRLAFEAASGGDLAPRFGAADGGRSDDLNDLGRDFDRMTGRLRSLMDGQTRLLHDVSHELRSPLARLQAAIGLAHQQPDKVATSLERIERESVRMDKLVGELLTLSRLEAGPLNSLNQDISIADMVEEIVADARFEALAQRVRIEVAGAADVLVIGQADLLGRALENVVRNAIKHSPADAGVELALSVDGDGRHLRIDVRDRGPGVAPADLGAIFQPFFRGNDTQHSTDGHGLGLAIAQHVIEAHGGGIGARNRSGGGLCVEIILPIAPARA